MVLIVNSDDIDNDIDDGTDNGIVNRNTMILTMVMSISKFIDIGDNGIS